MRKSTRRDFVRKAVAAAVLPVLSPSGSFKFSPGRRGAADFRVDNPYENVDWSKYHQIASASHVHVPDQQKLDKVYNILKLRHIPISNYYPSVPYYPPETIKKGQFMVKQDFGTIYDAAYPGRGSFKNGRFINGPLEWNKIIMDAKTGWYDKIAEKYKRELPFRESGPLFTGIPTDAIFSPNSEHHTFLNAPLHANALGSFFCSGTFDAHNEYMTVEHGFCPGAGQNWQDIFPQILDKLQYKDAGGITINHPVWSGLDYENVCWMLDSDNRVLGIEVYNDLCATGYGDPMRGWALKMWDQILSSGRKCLGFFVPDWTVGRGKNILLVPAADGYNCLKAYRNGQFFGSVTGTNLKFTSIKLEGATLYAETNEKVTFRLVTDKGEPAKEEGNKNIEFKIPLNSQGLPEIKYIRIEAWDETSEQIYSQPIRFLV